MPFAIFFFDRSGASIKERFFFVCDGDATILASREISLVARDNKLIMQRGEMNARFHFESHANEADASL